MAPSPFIAQANSLPPRGRIATQSAFHRKPGLGPKHDLVLDTPDYHARVCFLLVLGQDSGKVAK